MRGWGWQLNDLRLISALGRVQLVVAQVHWSWSRWGEPAVCWPRTAAAWDGCCCGAAVQPPAVMCCTTAAGPGPDLWCH